MKKLSILLFSFWMSGANAGACLDTDLVAERINQLTEGMALSNAQAIMVCDSTALSAEVDMFGRSKDPVMWQSANKTVIAKFMGGRLVEVTRSGAPDSAIGQSLTNPATFDGTVLTIPALNVGNAIFSNVRISLPAGGKWALTGVADVNGVEIPVPPVIEVTGAAIASGNLGNFYGLTEGTIFNMGGQLWRGMSGCEFPGAAAASTTVDPVTGLSVAPTTSSTIPANPLGTIYEIGGEYSIMIQGAAESCNVQKLTP